MKLKKYLGIALAGILSLSCLVGCGNASNNAPDTSDSSTTASGLAKIKEKGKFIVGLDDQLPPMGFRDEKGEIIGFDIDLAKEVAKRMGVEVEFKPIVWDTKEISLNQGEIDMIWNGLTITEPRKKAMSFTKPYLQNKQVVIVPNGSDIQTIANLKDKTIGLQGGSSAQDAVEANEEAFKSFKEIKKYENNVDILMDLQIGGIDAAVMDSVLALYLIPKNNFDFIVLGEDFGTEDYGIGMRLEDTDLASEVDRILDEMRTDGTFDTISKNWFK